MVATGFQLLAVCLAELFQSTLGKHRIKQDVRFPCFGSDQCEACAPLYDIPSFIRDMDRQHW